MNRYIDAEKAIKVLKSLGNRDYRREKGTIQDAIKVLSYPDDTLIADVQEIVRCKDCIMRDKNGICQFLCAYTWDDFFCQNGEKAIVRGGGNA